MAVYFKAKARGEREWRTLNSLHASMDGTGALIESGGGAVHLISRLGADWSGEALKLELSADHFRELAQAMLDADPEHATKAFGAALVIGPRSPLYDEDGRELG